MTSSQSLDLQLPLDIAQTVKIAIAEDLGTGDVTAELIPAEQYSEAHVITREEGIMCGQAWVEEVYQQLDPSTEIIWHAQDGDKVSANQKLFSLKGKSRTLLTGERTALNFLQTLSSTASQCHDYASLVKGLPVQILDTRKTLPGLRTAQKYAVSCGGCFNHRIGLFDAFLIKENHIAACGSIKQAVASARKNHPQLKLEVEVETMDEFNQAQEVLVDVIMLDNFSLDDIAKAVALRLPSIKLEVSGGIENDQLIEIAKTGVDYISVGALTKHCRAMDLSFRLV